MRPEEEPQEPSTEEAEKFEPAFKPETAETLKDGSELVGDRLDTIVLGTTGFGEISNYFIVDKDDPDPKETQWNSTGIGTSKSVINDHLGQYTDMNGFIAYVPKSGNEYCLMASTEENRAAVAAMGYEGNTNVGVYSFKGGEQLETKPGTGSDPTFLNAQIELLKLQSEHDGTRMWLEKAKKDDESSEIDKLQGQYEVEEIAIKDAREHVAVLSQEKPYLITRFA